MPKRRSWGTITHVSRDKHVIRYIDSQGARKSVTFYGTRREAEAELARLRLMHERNQARRKPPTVKQAAEAWWLPWIEREFEGGGMSANTRKAYLYAWSRVVEPRWGNVRLDAVKPSEVQSWLDSMSYGTAHHSMIVLRKIADFAAKRDEESTTAFSLKYDMPRKSKTRSKAVCTLEEADALLDSLRGSVVEAPFIAACFGSCRVGESLAVEVASVERVESHGVTLAVAEVRAQMGLSGFTPNEMLKTDSSRRVIVIPGRWGGRFLEIADERRAVGSEWMADRGDGLPMNQKALKRHWDCVQSEGGHMPFSNLRNSWRTFAQATWRIDYDLLEVLMGHRLEGVTGRHYLRFTREQIVEQFAREYTESLNT